jgi:DNA-binding NtrC family response regulator
MESLRAYQWPGNIRELENLIERLAILSEGGRLEASDLPDYIRGGQRDCQIVELGEDLPATGVDFNELVDKFETQLISMALSKTNWNKKAAARLLKLNRTTLVEKIKKKGLAERIEMSVEDESDDAAQTPAAFFRLNE